LKARKKAKQYKSVRLRLVEEFDKAAQLYGYYTTEGSSDELKDAEAVHTALKERLIESIKRIERQVANLTQAGEDRVKEHIAAF